MRAGKDVIALDGIRRQKHHPPPRLLGIAMASIRSSDQRAVDCAGHGIGRQTATAHQTDRSLIRTPGSLQGSPPVDVRHRLIGRRQNAQAKGRRRRHRRARRVQQHRMLEGGLCHQGIATHSRSIGRSRFGAAPLLCQQAAQVGENHRVSRAQGRTSLQAHERKLAVARPFRGFAQQAPSIAVGRIGTQNEVVEGHCLVQAPGGVMIRSQAQRIANRCHEFDGPRRLFDPRQSLADKRAVWREQSDFPSSSFDPQAAQHCRCPSAPDLPILPSPMSHVAFPRRLTPAAPARQLTADTDRHTH